MSRRYPLKKEDEVTYNGYVLKVRTVSETWFCATNVLTQQAFVFTYAELGHRVHKL